jgi:hypothetical protein
MMIRMGAAMALLLGPLSQAGNLKLFIASLP